MVNLAKKVTGSSSSTGISFLSSFDSGSISAYSPSDSIKSVSTSTQSLGSFKVDAAAMQQLSIEAKNLASKLDESWKNIVNNVDALSTSWAGKDCDSYINNIKANQTKINNLIEALNLMGTTCSKVSEITTQTVDQTYAYVKNVG